MPASLSSLIDMPPGQPEALAAGEGASRGCLRSSPPAPSRTTTRPCRQDGRRHANTRPAPPSCPPAATATPDAALWAALVTADPHGASIADLIQATGKGRTWGYERLRHFADAGRVIETIRSHSRAATPPR